jgi:phosphoglycolate phosphatase-like HAD superfamily hydrolase
MLKSLYPRVDWDTVRIVGCDMDGTLYDEADFIAQVYRAIANLLAATGDAKAEILHAWMVQRWLEKGSSYPHIFYEATTEAGTPREDVAKTVVLCLELFRNYQPVLTLGPRVKIILDALCVKYPLFLVSDGSARLQQRKFDALELGRWFDSVNVGISGYHGPEFSKPSIKIINKIKVLEKPCLPQQILFFGDRPVDAEFAANAGFQFVQVACMHPVNVS